MNVSYLASSLIIIFGSVLALIFGKSLLFPFLFALLIYFLIRSIRRYIDRNNWVRTKVPSWLKNLISSLFIFTLIGFTGEMLILNSQHFVHSFSNYQSNIDQSLAQLNNSFGVDISQKISENIQKFEISKAINPLLNSITGIMGSLMMVLFYLLFLFIEESNFKKKLHLIFSKPEKYDQIKLLLKNIEHSITHYIGLKTLISFISSTICFVVMFAFGIDSPLLWAFVIFILNFIPVIGAFLVALLPSTFAILQFGEINLPLILFFTLGTIQTVIGNVIEPKLMGDSLNISPLVALFSLAFWGAIWGILGMVVSVPITVILIILLAHFPKTKSIAIFLSHHGKI
jgi:predicted PurR-regulated permease PerM